MAKRAQAGSVAQVREDGSLGKLRAEVKHQRFVGEAVEAIALNAGFEITLRKRQMRCDLGHGAMKSIVETGEVRGRGKTRLSRRNQLQRLRNVQGGEVRGGTQFVEELWGDELMGAEFGTTVYDAMAYRRRHVMNV